MNPNAEHLVVLQAIDLERKHLSTELAEAPRRVARAEAERSAAEAARVAAEQGLRKEEALRRSQESDITGHRGKINRLRKQMESATSGAQISALEHEIGFAEAAISKLEDEELASMERTEKLEAELASAATRVAATTSSLETERARAAEIKQRNTATLAERDSERAAVRAQIEERALSIYDRVSKNRGTGISEAINHQCSACQMMVRPQRWNDLTGRDHDHELFTCETCGRVLVWDPRRDAPGQWPAGDRLTAAKKLEVRT